MTIHQAKNREFDGVIVLWPFTVGGNIESQRRLLYNALTRAQKWAIVIVQDNQIPINRGWQDRRFPKHQSLNSSKRNVVPTRFQIKTERRRSRRSFFGK
jgi:superfamily I DNA/RNA helicase